MGLLRSCLRASIFCSLHSGASSAITSIQSPTQSRQIKTFGPATTFPLSLVEIFVPQNEHSTYCVCCLGMSDAVSEQSCNALVATPDGHSERQSAHRRQKQTYSYAGHALFLEHDPSERQPACGNWHRGNKDKRALPRFDRTWTPVADGVHDTAKGARHLIASAMRQPIRERDLRRA